MEQKIQSLTDRMTPEQLELYYAIVNEYERYRSLSQPEKLNLIREVLDKPYLDLLCDWAFKHVFGNNLDLLQMLLRDILQMDLTVQESLPNEIDKFGPDDKNIIMDVICRLRDGRRIIVEMQQEKKAGFKDRIAYYAAANFIKQLKRGEKYTEVHAVYVVCFVNFKMQHTDCPPGKIVYAYELREQDTGELYGEYISLNFCELPRLAKTSFDTLSPKEQWFHLLKNMRNFALNPKGVPERMKRVLEAARTSALPGKEQLQYFRAMISDIEKEDIATANYKDGYDEGMEKGIEKGIEKGVEIGKSQQAAEIARKMLEDNEPLEKIVRYSGLTKEQIKAL